MFAAHLGDDLPQHVGIAPPEIAADQELGGDDDELLPGARRARGAQGSVQAQGAVDVARRGFSVAVQEAEEGKALAGTCSPWGYGQQVTQRMALHHPVPLGHGGRNVQAPCLKLDS